MTMTATGFFQTRAYKKLPMSICEKRFSGPDVMIRKNLRALRGETFEKCSILFKKGENFNHPA